jgi:Protein of unknown function (DUF3040)
VPLSEEEQRVLDEIERNFYGSDPDLARAVSSAEPIAVAPRSTLGVGLVAFISGIAIVTFGYTTSPFIGLLGVGAMIWGGLHVWKHAMRYLADQTTPLAEFRRRAGQPKK